MPQDITTLTDAQLKNEQYIINWALTNGLTPEDSEYLVKVAWIESSFGANLQNTSPGSTASGEFGFTTPTWTDRYSDLGDKNNLNNQLQAMSREISTFKSWYNDPSLNSNIPANMSLQEYMYIKHHDGVHATPSFTCPAAQIWDANQINVVIVPGQRAAVGSVEYDENPNGIYDVAFQGGYALGWDEGQPLTDASYLITNPADFIG